MMGPWSNFSECLPPIAATYDTCGVKVGASTRVKLCIPHRHGGTPCNHSRLEDSMECDLPCPDGKYV